MFLTCLLLLKIVILQDGVFLMYIFGGCSDSVTIDGGVQAVKGVKMEIGVAVSQGMTSIMNNSLSICNLSLL